jgi:hypothetical protein
MTDLIQIEKPGTQLLNTPIRIEFVSLSGQTNNLGFNPCYLVSLEDYWDKLLGGKYDHKKTNVEVPKNDMSGQSNILQEELPVYFDKNLQKIRNSFSKELTIKKGLLKDSINSFKETFDRISKFIAELDFEFENVEITNQSGIKFSLLFPENKLLLISKSVYPERIDFNSDEVIFSFFINRKLIVSDVSEFPTLTKGFKKYLTM